MQSPKRLNKFQLGNYMKPLLFRSALVRKIQSTLCGCTTDRICSNTGWCVAMSKVEHREVLAVPANEVPQVLFVGNNNSFGLGAMDFMIENPSDTGSIFFC